MANMNIAVSKETHAKMKEVKEVTGISMSRLANDMIELYVEINDLNNNNNA